MGSTPINRNRSAHRDSMSITLPKVRIGSVAEQKTVVKNNRRVVSVNTRVKRRGQYLNKFSLMKYK